MHTLPLLFNDVDGYEVLVIILVVLIFFGPKSIPGIAKTLGRALFSIRTASEELKNEIRKSGVDIKKDLNINDILKQQEEQILQPMDQVFTDIGNTIHYEGNKVNTVIEQNQEPVTTLPVTEEVDQTEASKPNQDKTPSDEV
ncbi:MAG: twin-arginine translocase TatA/TatE family subunit [Flavobacteriales bacterium]|jgi:Sec-independent protein translocase protein TatA